MMDTILRVKLRPDTHYAPVSKGVYWSRPGGRSFVLAGPGTLFGLIDARLDLLTAGTSVDDLVGSVGDESARPVFAHIVDTLLAQDMVFDVHAAGPVPDAATTLRYADVLGYLETQCAHPYERFARLRAARITVRGAGPAVDNLVRSLRGYGIGQVDVSSAADLAGPAPDLVVVIDDADHHVDLREVAAAVPTGTPLLPVLAGTRMAVVGTALADRAHVDAFIAAGARIADWLRADGGASASRPVSAAFAGSLAARAVLDELLGLAGEARATVIHGGTLECDQVPLTPPAAPPWRAWGAADDVPEPAAAVDPATEPDQVPDSIHQRAARLTTRWSGTARWGDDLDLPQLPVALATLRNVTAAGTAVLGWGTDRADAGADALLALLRATATAQVPSQPGWVAAAGTSARRFIVDGLLRLTAKRWLAELPPRELGAGDAAAWIARSLSSVLADYFDAPVSLRLREAPGLDWALVTAIDGTGAALTHQWGPSRAIAVHAALAAVTARCQLAEDPTSHADPDPIGTWALRTATTEQLDGCHAQLTALAGHSGHRVTGRLLAVAPGSDPLPLYAGLVGLE